MRTSDGRWQRLIACRTERTESAESAEREQHKERETERETVVLCYVAVAAVAAVISHALCSINNEATLNLCCLCCSAAFVVAVAACCLLPAGIYQLETLVCSRCPSSLQARKLYNLFAIAFGLRRLHFCCALITSLSSRATVAAAAIAGTFSKPHFHLGSVQHPMQWLRSIFSAIKSAFYEGEGK